MIRWEAEGGEHHCMHPSTELLLALYLEHPGFRERLDAAGMQNPFGALAASSPA